MTLLSQYTTNSIKANQLAENFVHSSEPLLYHPHIKNHSANAYFFSKAPIFSYMGGDGNIKQTVQVRSGLTKLASDLSKYAGLVDVYISVNQMGASRKQESLLYTTMFYTDLDIYHTDKAGITKERLIEQVLAHCEFYDIPCPNLIVYSGNGYYLKWIYSEKMARKDLPINRYNDVQKSINRIFLDFGADPKAMDVSRVLRLPGTINSKTGNLCEVIYYQDERLSSNVMYDIFTRYYVADPVIPKVECTPTKQRIEKVKEPKLEIVYKKRDSSKAPTKTLSRMQLPKDRYDDLKELIKLRSGNVDNSRMTFLFWLLNFKALYGATNFVDFGDEAQIISSELGLKSSDWSYQELTTLERKIIRHNNGYQKIKKQDGEYFKLSNLYTPKNEKLINIFAITDEEQIHLKTIISQNEKNRRRAQKRLDLGMKPQTGITKDQPWKDLKIGKTKYYEMKKKGLL